MSTSREPIYCDCHGTEVMGYRLTSSEVVWYDKRHGVQHTVKVVLGKYANDTPTDSSERKVSPSLTARER